MIIEVTYLGYLAISIALTIWVARTLSNERPRFLSTASRATSGSRTR